MEHTDNVKVCEQYEYCTNCPIRIGCPTRLLFYESDEEFEKDLAFVIYLRLHFDSSAILETNQFAFHIHKKRNHELELHPTHSAY